MVIKSNRYKAQKTGVFLLGLAATCVTFILFQTLDVREIVDAEVQVFQSKFPSFSSVRQLSDEGINGRDPLSLEMLGATLRRTPAVIYDGFTSDARDDLPRIELFIKFKHLEAISRDRSDALSKSININPQYVPCKISDGFKIFKCKARLKGDLPDHWDTPSRFSLKIKVKGGYIHGMKSFSIQKPKSRQFPYDHVFQEINADLGRLANNNQKYAAIRVNKDTWGVMLVEPSVDDTFLEVRDLKRSGVFRISDQDIWAYNKDKDSYDGYFLSDPTVTISQSGESERLFKEPAVKEIYSHIYRSISTKDGNVFNRKLMIGNLGLALAWGDLHTLWNSNAKYTWNAYEQRLEPILSDQGVTGEVSRLFAAEVFNLPYEFKTIFQDHPLKASELMDELVKLDQYFENNSVIDKANYVKDKFFKNDSRFSQTHVYANLAYLKNSIDKVVSKINDGAKFEEKSFTKSFDDKKINSIKNFVKVVHFDNGIVRVYNYLDRPVQLVELIARGEKIEINKEILGSKANSLSYSDIATELVGDFSGMISVTAEVQGFAKTSKNALSLIDFEYSKEKPHSSLDTAVCDNDGEVDACVVSGNHFIAESIIFEEKVVISAGTKIFLGAGVDLIFESSVNMDGLEEKPIQIQGNSSGGIFINNRGNAVSILKHVNVYRLATTSSALRKYTGAINGYGGVFNIDNVKIDGCDAEDQLNLVDTEIQIDGLFISNAPSDAFDCDFCRGRVTNFRFDQIGGDGLDVSGSELSVIAMEAYSVNDKALSVGERSELIVSDARFDNVGTGVAVKDASIVKIDKIKMQNILHDAFMTYVKKPFFIGKTKLTVSRFDKAEFGGKSVCIREANTDLTLNGQLCQISELSVDDLYRGRMKK